VATHYSAPLDMVRRDLQRLADQLRERQVLVDA
jgi:hypothetical protein